MSKKKKVLMAPTGALALALKSWDKVCEVHPMPRTQRKCATRRHMVVKLVKKMEARGLDWRTKEVWRELFGRVALDAPRIQAERAIPDFRVTFDWAVAPRNVRAYL